MPAYNAERTLPDALDSVIAQTWPHWELILVVDRQSSDQTHAIAKAYAEKDARIHLVTGLPEGGCAYNRNHGIHRAQGEFIAFLDSDDLWLPPKLDRQVRYMRATNSDICCTGYNIMDWDGNELPYKCSPPPRISYKQLLNENLIGCLTVMLRRARFPTIQFVEYLHEDYILWLQLLKEADAHGIAEALAIYRVAPQSRSGNKARAAYARWRILRDFEKLPLHRSLYCFMNYVATALIKRATNFRQTPRHMTAKTIS